MSENSHFKAVRDSEDWWQLEGESDLYALLIPNPPAPGSTATVRLTHSNSCGPFDGVAFFVRLGNPDEPTEQDDLESRKDWIRADLVEELVWVDEKEVLRSEAEEFEDET